MSDTKEQDRNARIGLTRQSGNRLELKKGVDQGTVRQSFSHGRSKSVAVEVKRRRVGGGPRTATTTVVSPGKPDQQTSIGTGRKAESKTATGARTGSRGGSRAATVLKPLTEEEKLSRAKALSEARRVEGEARKRAEENARRASEEAARRKAEEDAAAERAAEEAARRKSEEDARRRAEEQAARLLAEEEAKRQAEEEAAAKAERIAIEAEEQRKKLAEAEPTTKPEPGEKRAKPAGAKQTREPMPEPEDDRRGRRGKGDKRSGPRRQDRDHQRRGGRISLGMEEEERFRSMAALKRQRERERRQHTQSTEPIVREVVLPETITVQDLSARMAVRGAEVVKALMRNGIMATINQSIDADTAELVVEEFGHTVKRVSESDVEEGVEGIEDNAEDLHSRPPVVTVMGHVDHGKTSLLDALRKSDVVAGEAGGITQHIGAYQVDIGSGTPVSFIDTPGHAAFTTMRARGASVTDIVVLVVAADDGVMPQTVEAISHAKAAKVPMIVAINKMDRPEADPDRVRQELLNHEVIDEAYGGDVLSIEVSAVKGTNLDKLIEAIQLQAEVLELQANPNREAQGVIIEAKLDRGRGVVATVLVQRGTLRQGDIVVVGANWGRVRALIDDHGKQVKVAGPAMPVEILGLDGVPEAGDLLSAVENERRARDIADYRQRKRREQGQLQIAGPGASMEDIFAKLKSGDLHELPVVMKSDVHGSLEALQAGVEKIGNEEAKVRVLHGAVGGITESDVTLAQASGAVILGFNVRANAQAREAAKRDGVEIRYYSIIYELLDDVKGMLTGMLSPESRESIIGHAEIREVFSISKVGKIAGCMIIDGVMRRHARARLLRDDVVIYDGALGSLKRFKDDVREVREGFECGTSIDGYNDIRQGDVIEAYELEEVARSL